MQPAEPPRAFGGVQCRRPTAAGVPPPASLPSSLRSKHTQTTVPATWAGASAPTATAAAKPPAAAAASGGAERRTRCKGRNHLYILSRMGSGRGPAAEAGRAPADRGRAPSLHCRLQVGLNVILDRSDMVNIEPAALVHAPSMATKRMRMLAAGNDAAPALLWWLTTSVFAFQLG